MRQREPLCADLELAEQQQVDVDRPRAVSRAAESPPMLGLDRLAEVEQLVGVEGRRDPNRGVEEIGLIEDLPHRLGLVEGRDRIDGHTVSAQVLNRAVQMRLPIADVRAETEIARDLTGRAVARPRINAQTPSSSSGSRSRER